MRALAITGLLAMATAGAQPAGPIAFKGIQLGTSEARLREAFPSFRCSASTDPVQSDRNCTLDRQHAGASVFASLDEIPLRDIVAMFVDNRLVQLKIVYDSDDFARMERALTTMFGTPTRTETVVINRRGATIPDAMTRWSLATGTVDSRRYGMSLDRAVLTLSVPDHIALVQRRQLEAVKGGLKVQ